MTVTALADELTPLERLRVRDVMQDLWRVQVRRITLLTLEMYDVLEAEEPTLVEAGATPEQIEAALTEARKGLADLESAMHRLDDGHFGRCTSCGSVIDFSSLMADPLSALCLRCRPPRIGLHLPLTIDAGRCGG